ncbi:hypothetical protein NKDENANG_00371 [Candidatus Entotheonellaceae bacterium PAL068K]
MAQRQVSDGSQVIAAISPWAAYRPRHQNAGMGAAF